MYKWWKIFFLENMQEMALKTFFQNRSVISNNDEKSQYTPTAITAPQMVFPIPDTAPLIMLFGFGAKKAIKLGIFIVLNSLKTSGSSSLVEEWGADIQ